MPYTHCKFLIKFIWSSFYFVLALLMKKVSGHSNIFYKLFVMLCLVYTIMCMYWKLWCNREHYSTLAISLAWSLIWYQFEQKQAYGWVWVAAEVCSIYTCIKLHQQAHFRWRLHPPICLLLLEAVTYGDDAPGMEPLHMSFQRGVFVIKLGVLSKNCKKKES